MKCSICQGELTESDEKTKCPECNNRFHSECWSENGGCGTPGCRCLPKISTKNEQHHSQSTYWGIKDKTCPACGEKISVEAYICPFCDEEFDTNIPIDQSEFKEGKIIRYSQMSSNGKIAILVFIFGIIGCTSFLNLIIGGIWFKKNKGPLKDESPVCYFLAVAGLLISIIYLLLFIIGFMIFMLS